MTSAPTSATALEARRPARWDGLVARAATRPVLAATGVAAVVRVAVALTSFALNHPVLIPDEGGYIGLARTVARGGTADSWSPGYGQSLYHSTWAFTATLTRLFDVFGPSRLVGQLLAAALGTATVALTVVLTARFASRRAALLAGFVVALLPSSVLWSSTVLRESLVWCAAGVVALGIALAVGRGKQSAVGVAMVLIGLLVLGATRGQTELVAAWAAILVALTLRGRPVLMTALLGVCLLAPAVNGLGVGGITLIRSAGGSLGSTRAYLSLDAKTSIVQHHVVGHALTTTSVPNDRAGGPLAIARRHAPVEGHVIAGDQGQLYEVDDSAGASLRAAPTGLLAALVRPFPWEATATATAWGARVENVLWWGLYVLAGIGFWHWRRRGAGIWFPALFAVGIVASSAVTQGNVGTAFRHRAQFLWVLAFLGAAGVEALVPRARLRRRPVAAASEA